MQQDFMDSVKARLYDFKYTPFLSSYIFAWIYWNSKSILIFFSDKLTIQNKIDMLSYNNIDYTNPLLFALFYVFIFPLASAVFYATTLGYRLLMNKIQQMIQDKTPLPQIEANKIINENVILQEQINEKNILISKVKSEKEEEITKIKSEYSDKEQGLETKITEQVAKRTEQIEEELATQKSEVEACLRRFSEEQKKCSNLEKENIELKEKSQKLENENSIQTYSNNDEIDHLITTLSDTQKQILKVFNDNDTRLQTSFVKTKMKENNKINKPHSEDDINSLINELSIIQNTNTTGYIQLTETGLKVVNRLFNNK